MKIPPRRNAIGDGTKPIQRDTAAKLLKRGFLFKCSSTPLFYDFHDSVSERLRRWTRDPLGSARRGSNPLAVDEHLGTRRSRRKVCVKKRKVSKGRHIYAGRLLFMYVRGDLN